MAFDRRPEYEEGPDAASRFTDAMGRILQVSKDELIRRESADKQSRKRKKTRAKKSA